MRKELKALLIIFVLNVLLMLAVAQEEIVREEAEQEEIAREDVLEDVSEQAGELPTAEIELSSYVVHEIQPYKEFHPVTRFLLRYFGME